MHYHNRHNALVGQAHQETVRIQARLISLHHLGLLNLVEDHTIDLLALALFHEQELLSFGRRDDSHTIAAYSTT
jgi:hypothetical protein